MNLTQKQSILNSIESILAFNFDNFIIENSPSGNIDEIKFGEYTVQDFRNTYLKVFSQLREELEGGLGLMLPNQDTFNNEFSQVVLDTESNNFFIHVRNFASRNDAAEILKRFVYYQIREGFWNKSLVKQHNVNAEKLNEAQQNLILVQKNLSENLSIFENLKSDFQGQLDEFAVILTEKRVESAEITSHLEKAKLDTASIASLLAAATTNDTEISILAANIKSKLDIVSEDIEKYKEKFGEIENENKGLSAELKKDLEEVEVNLGEAKTGNGFIQSQKEEIMRLIGMAADGSLGYKFNSRKEDLGKGLRHFWRWAVPASILIALGWVVLVFTYLGAHLGNEWINLLINLIKTSPVWLLVGFVFSQYGKERNLQEEYAFKSAIAMTLTAYSQMLAVDDGGDNTHKSSKHEMLLKSIENLYTQPILKTDKSDKNELITPKQLIESLKSLLEMIKSVKD